MYGKYIKKILLYGYRYDKKCIVPAINIYTN